MRRIIFNGSGGPEVIAIEEVEIPKPSKKQVLIKVYAAGVNRPDCLQREGKYPPPKGVSLVPGLEVSGEIVSIGEEVDKKWLGSKVMALLIAGGYAEYAIADIDLCFSIPSALSFIEAAGVMEVAFTVYDNIFTRGKLEKGEALLIHGGAGGIGSFAISLSSEMGAIVYATAGSNEKCDFCVNMGAQKAFNYKKIDFVSAIKADRAGKGVDVILDIIGGYYIQKNLSLLEFDGRLIQIAFQKGSQQEIDLMPLMLKRLTITGSTLRARSLELKTQIANGLRDKILPLLNNGKVKPFIYKTFPLEEARLAHEMMEKGEHCGKIILQCTKDDKIG